MLKVGVHEKPDLSSIDWSILDNVTYWTTGIRQLIRQQTEISNRIYDNWCSARDVCYLFRVKMQLLLLLLLLSVHLYSAPSLQNP